MSEPRTRMRFVPRSGWLKSAPVSTTATVAPAPRVTLQASGAFTLTIPHWLPAQGSFVHETAVVRQLASSYAAQACGTDRSASTAQVETSSDLVVFMRRPRLTRWRVQEN